MEITHNRGRVVTIAMTVSVLSITMLCWNRSSTSAVSLAARDRESDRNPIQSVRGEVTPRSTSASADRVKTAYGKLPLSFEPNRGQTDPRVEFVSRTSGSTLFLTPTSAVIALKYLPKGGVNTVNTN